LIPAEDDAKAKSEEHGEGAAPNQASAICPMDWFFHGWITFKLFGPMAPQEKHLLLLAAGDPYLAEGVPKMSNGRAAHKNQDALRRKISNPCLLLVLFVAYNLENSLVLRTSNYALIQDSRTNDIPGSLY
jgi:hypothetical protein